MKTLISSLKCVTFSLIKRKTAVRTAWRRASRTALTLWLCSRDLRLKPACPSRLNQSRLIPVHFNQLAMQTKTMNTKSTPAARFNKDQQWLRAYPTSCRELSRSRTMTTVRIRALSSRPLSLRSTSSSSMLYRLRRKRRRLKPSPANSKHRPKFCSKGNRQPSMRCFWGSSKPWMRTRRAKTTAELIC